MSDIHYNVTISFVVDVEAPNEAEAEEQALKWFVAQEIEDLARFEATVTAEEAED